MRDHPNTVFGHAEIGRGQGNLRDLAVRRPQGERVLGKGGREHRRLFRAQRKAEPPDQFRRAVSADNAGRRNTVMLRQRCAKLPAHRIGVAVGAFQRINHRRPDAGGQAERTDVGREIQRPCPVFPFKSGPVAAVD